jgi:hypothetical protein
MSLKAHCNRLAVCAEGRRNGSFALSLRKQTSCAALFARFFLAGTQTNPGFGCLASTSELLLFSTNGRLTQDPVKHGWISSCLLRIAGKQDALAKGDSFADRLFATLR